jgi:hypothetical protein
MILLIGKRSQENRIRESILHRETEIEKETGTHTHRERERERER